MAIIIFVNACTWQMEKSKEESDRVKKEIKRLKDSIEINTQYKVQPQLQEKTQLEDTLNQFIKPFRIQIDIINRELVSTEKEYENKLAKVKEQHFVKHGHNPNSYTSLEKIIDNLQAQRENKRKKYQDELEVIEKKYKTHEFYMLTNKRISFLKLSIDEINKRTNIKYKKRIKELEDTLTVLNN
ncbi:hypothetical protein [Rhodocytophaga aerolata]|uniref:hypothetical protein n=1 Tax=Rhodocytophaga aerolata TaxID=455078 RepID=UPI00366CBA7E